MHFYNYNDQLRKIDRAGRGAIISRGIATGTIGLFLFATAFTLDLRLLLGSVLCLLICWMLESYFKLNEDKHQQIFDQNGNPFHQPNLKGLIKNWIGELFFSLNGIFYFLAILLHGVLFVLIQQQVML
ncbi:hypothetical protein DN752_00510 [Echinicola strongylocentroti]|uniref:Uncharacterized protein n=1 Tax=Echinicola strongylocentroti TaxID=1795355 RepID=A0A2Z4IDD3_9BACT|nr:hypothetical protein [Echinicola strongylocentroti]AWW28737.1 hypothetical protein DN752_00510 [Echinicola strongylocentroti]